MKFFIYLAFILLLFCNGLFGQYNSVLAEGNWYKITTNKVGIYKLSYSSINTLGIDVSNLKISDLKLYGNGGGMLPYLNSELIHDDLVENAIKIYDANNNGVFDSDDYMLFYGQSPHVWNFDASTQLFKHESHLFSNEVNYFLVVDGQTVGKRIQEKNTVQNATTTITSFNAFSFHESELENLIHSGKEWFGERFDVQNNRSFDFSFPNLISSNPVSIKTAVVARSLVPSVFTIKANGSTIQTINVPNIVTTYATEYAKIASETTDYNASSSNIKIKITYSHKLYLYKVH